MDKIKSDFRVGFAGLGRMGKPMVRNLVAAGFDVAVWNRTGAVSELFVDTVSCLVKESPADLSAHSEVVLTMLADDAAAEIVYIGPQGLLSGGVAGKAFAEMGTISPELARRIAGNASDKGATFVDAPVSGSTKAAANAQLVIMAGLVAPGPQGLQPVFDAIGKRTFWMGQPGHGSTMKLAVNMLIHGLNQTLSEALILAERAGIELPVAYEVIENSAAAAPVIHYRKDQYLNEVGQDVSFSTNLAAKDVSLALDLAVDCGASLPQAALNLDVLREAIAQGFGPRDMASVLNFMREKES